jgi:hypothetical protein
MRYLRQRRHRNPPMKITGYSAEPTQAPRKIPAAGLRGLCCVGLLLALAAFAPMNLITGDGGHSDVLPDLSKLNWARVVYGSEGGLGEAYYPYDGRLWARWETDFPEGDENIAHRLSQLTRIEVGPKIATRFLTASDLGDFPLLFMSDPGWMVLSREEKSALARYLQNGGFLWVDDFWGLAEWRQLDNVMAQVLPGRSWQVLPISHPIFHQVFDLKAMPQIPAIEYARDRGGTAEYDAGHKLPTGSLDEPQMRAWLDDDGRVMVLATHNTDMGDGWEREAYGDWYFETFSTKAYMIGVNVVVYAMTH